MASSRCTHCSRPRESVMFHRWGQRVVASARPILALSAVALLVSVVLGIGVFSKLLTGGFDDPASASSQAKALLDRQFGGEPDMIFLVHARTGTVDSAEVSASGK